MSKLQTLLEKFNKDHQADIVKVGVQRDDPERLPTGIFQLDLAIGGGIPVGRVTVVYGTESSMKTTLCLKLIAQAQKRWPDRKAVFVDLEGTLSTGWPRRVGVNTETLVYVQPTHAEQAVDVIENLTYAEDVSVIVVDSLAALVTQHELDSPAEKAMVGTQGIVINKLYRKITRALAVAQEQGRQPTLVFINQIRFKVGVMMGDPETMPGGPSFKFAASLVLRLYGKDEYLKELSTSLPAYKKVSVIVKKWKVPITARNSEFMISTLPNEKLKLAVGDSYDIGTILHYLKHYELLVKDKKAGWILRDEHGEILAETKTLDAFESKVRDDEAFSAAVRALIIRVVIEKGDQLDAE
jgi:recombination protein RecA